MKIQNNTCLRCGALQFTEYCEFCEPNMVWVYDDHHAHLVEIPPKEPPTEEEMEDMAESHGLVGELFMEDEPDNVVDEYDRYDHLRDG